MASKNKSTRVVSFTHYRPYDGCYDETHYMALVPSKQLYRYDLVPIVYPQGGNHPTPHTLRELCESPWVEDVQIERWETEYPYHEHWTPQFWDFAQEHGLEFSWECAYCGPTEERPADHGGDYRGNGGVGIVIYSWLCEECYYRMLCGYCDSLNNDQSPWWDYDEDLVYAYEELGLCPACLVDTVTDEKWDIDDIIFQRETTERLADAKADLEKGIDWAIATEQIGAEFLPSLQAWQRERKGIERVHMFDWLDELEETWYD